MILVDMNQVMISNLMMQISVKNGELEEGLVRHMVLSSLRMYRRKFGEKFGELVLCYDSKNYWRKKIFPQYKASRKKDRENSNQNWGKIFEVLNKLRDEFKKYLPYRVMCVDGAEADDVIAVLTKDQGIRNIRLQKDMQPPVPILILSGDKDFVQLQKYPFVKQYNPVKKSFVECPDPHLYILEHIIKGDKSDGIPNCLSPDDTFTKSGRQRPISKKNFSLWLDKSPEQFCNTEQMSYYNRNSTLIDFKYIPKDIEEKIIEHYDNAARNNRRKVYEYFVSHQLLELLNHVGDF
ncbi:RNase H [Synechococcus phage S-CBM2]|nr:RNase H [Synechococcus phage S-CBM2]